ncbi:hypothetical protein JCM10908_006080 [Rhodotorula pacifica]|uniref:uncharacterized protein n=1 Tax=Rhodotorula pacifica TaxID=1495444 RepID=UPI00317859CC
MNAPYSVFLSYARTKEWPNGALILEFAATFVVWALFLGGAAALSNKYSSWGWCFGTTCSLARAVEAWSWLSWISATFLLVFVGIAGCMGPDRDDDTPGRNREVVGATEMGVPAHHGAATTGQPQPQQEIYPTGQTEPKAPAAPSAYATGNMQGPKA